MPGAKPLVVDARDSIDVWPAVSVRFDPGRQWTLAEVAARPQDFAAPAGTPGNFGRIADAVWLHVGFQVTGHQPRMRILEFDYPALNRIDVYQVQRGQLVSASRLGNELRMADRPVRSRTHAVALMLEPGAGDLYVRVQTSSSMVLPMTLRAPEAFAAQESRAQLLQGVVAGLGLFMLLYSLSHWVSLRDIVFVDYALLLGGNLVFAVTNFGLGGQYLWPDQPALSMQLSPLGVLLAVAAASRFMRTLMNMDRAHRLASWFARVECWLAIAGIVLDVAGLLDYRHASQLAMVLGVTITLTMVPVSLIRLWRGERIAAYMLFGWSFYVVGSVDTALLVQGLIEPGFWSQYLYPLATMIEMAAWMSALALRERDTRRAADRARLESQALRQMAHTDVLTGLPNRRGLQQKLAEALDDSSPQQLLAVYLLDLDGFKLINDRCGHDVGDLVLIAVGERLQSVLRTSDTLARLGGDEFVVLAPDLPDEASARRIGLKMLASFEPPVVVADQICVVGLTVGYALAPLDGKGADELLKRADAAMYAGKHAGGHRLERGGRATLGATATA